MKKFVVLLFITVTPLLNKVSFAQDPWDDFTVPYLNFSDEDDGETQGAQVYHALVPDKEAYILPVCEDVSRLIYFDPSEALNVLFLNYTIEHYDGISQKSGAPPSISILFSTQHIETVWDATEDSLAIEAEIYGILFHELTHGYQLEPVGAGEYDGSSEFWAAIEGLADAVRIRAGYHQNTSPSNSPSKWLAGYTTTGYFYNWIANNYDCDFLKKLNLSINTIEPWTFEEACMSITSIHADTLWNTYIENLGVGERPDPAFEADQTLVEVGQSVNFTNLSEGAFCHAWTFEGGSPRRSYDDNPTITYNTPGKYKVTLVSQNTNTDGTGIEVKDHYITVVAGLNTPENTYKKTTFTIRPNPFTVQSELKLVLPKPTTVQIEIMDLSGRQVTHIYNGELPTGEQTFIWDGRDSSAQQVAAGTYFWKIIEDEKTRTEAIQYHH